VLERDPHGLRHRFAASDRKPGPQLVERPAYVGDSVEKEGDAVRRPEAVEQPRVEDEERQDVLGPLRRRVERGRILDAEVTREQDEDRSQV
jgi:hypothetical protein